MRLLWMKSDDIFPPDTGGKIRSYNLMRGLCELCDVTYVCLQTPEQSASARPDFDVQRVGVVHAEEHKQGLRFYARVLRGMASSLPYTVQKYRVPEFREVQRRFVAEAEAAGEPAVILCDFLEMADNVEWSLRVPKVLFQHNVESEIWTQYWEKERNPAKRLYFDFERRRMTRYESMICNAFDRVFTVTHEDKDRLAKVLGVTRPVDVLETGVDTDFFAPMPNVRPVPERLVFLGSLDWMPNIDGVRWFMREVYGPIRRARPGVSLDVVGRRPTAEIRELLGGDDSVRLLPDVPDVRPAVATADLFIVPLRIGGGSRIKIYEAMAMGRPVVSTTLGAQGLPLTPGREIAIGDAPEAFAAQVTSLLADASAKEALAAQGLRYVSEHCEWRHVSEFLHAQCAKLSGSDRGE